MVHKDFLSALDQKAIVEAIGRAEKNCSGEIRVHVQPKVHGGEIRPVAERTFERLGMTKTSLRNGVLLFIASEEQRFVILGDKGIDEKVGPGFWDDIAAHLTEEFKAQQFTRGIVDAIDRCGEALKGHYPYQTNDADELTNDLSIHHD